MSGSRHTHSGPYRIYGRSSRPNRPGTWKLSPSPNLRIAVWLIISDVSFSHFTSEPGMRWLIITSSVSRQKCPLTASEFSESWKYSAGFSGGRSLPLPFPDQASGRIRTRAGDDAAPANQTCNILITCRRSKFPTGFQQKKNGTVIIWLSVPLLCTL